MNTQSKRQAVARLSELEVSAVRRRLLQMHFESGVGHIGGNLSVIDCLLVLFHEVLAPQDALVLSKGHSAGALYASLWSVGKLDDADLKTFHKEATLLPGHPPSNGIDDILFATGSLGHGLSLSCGLAMAHQLEGSDDDLRVFCVMSDGEWQEGSTWEALIFAQHHCLKNLTVFVDVNGLQGFGGTDEVASMDAPWSRVSAFAVDTRVIDGHDLAEIREAASWKSTRPRLVFMKTTKGKGVKFMENKMSWHYLPMTQLQFDEALAELALRERQ